MVTPKGRCLNTGRTHFKKGFTPWNKGLTKDKDHRLDFYRPTIFKKGVFVGDKSPSYNNGLSFYTREKRWFIVCRDGKTIPYTRAVMECELHRELFRWEVVHHINRNKIDDRPENLQVLTRAEHIRIHKPRERKNVKSHQTR